MKHIVRDLQNSWTTRGETIHVCVGARQRGVGSRIAGHLRAPHPPPDNAPAVYVREPTYPHPYADPTPEWTEDDSLAWWADAATPTDDAAHMADHLALGRGEAGIAITDRRIAVLLPEKLLTPRRKLSLETDYWSFRDKVVSLWETDATRIRDWSTTLAGSSFPFPRLLLVSFHDGSTLAARLNELDIVG